jgi:hypothetical protein
MTIRQKLGMDAVTLLAFVQGVLRTYFGLAGAGMLGAASRDQVMSLIDTPVANELVVIAAPFLLLGVLGIAATVGLALRRPWGLYSTVIVSLATIAYDLWAILEIQSSALIGLVVPAICIAYLVMRRDAFRSSAAVSA